MPKVVLPGYLGASGHDFTYPAIGVTASGRACNDVTGGMGAAADDGFSGYKQQNFPNPIRSRRGDYGAAAVDGNTIWIAGRDVGPIGFPRSLSRRPSSFSQSG